MMIGCAVPLLVTALFAGRRSYGLWVLIGLAAMFLVHFLVMRRMHPAAGHDSPPRPRADAPVTRDAAAEEKGHSHCGHCRDHKQS